ncbi:MAG: TIGR03435 family protein [Bryobacteraceae bacterium]
MIRAIASLALFASWAVYGQSPAAARFEVASVKPSNLDQFAGSSGLRTGHGRLTASNVTLKRCIMGAYGVGPNQISGGPAWLDSDRYEIVAKAEQPVDDDAALMAMLQSLLSERFKLAFHRATRTVEAFVLEVAKNGPKLEKAEDRGSSTNSSRGLIDAKTITMDRFAEVLSRQMDLPVLNHTGLAGSFDLKLEWTPESRAPARPGADDAMLETGVSIFTAIQQQLGLRLRAKKTPVEVIVIDHAERPSEN